MSFVYPPANNIDLIAAGYSPVETSGPLDLTFLGDGYSAPPGRAVVFMFDRAFIRQSAATINFVVGSAPASPRRRVFSAVAGRWASPKKVTVQTTSVFPLASAAGLSINQPWLNPLTADGDIECTWAVIGVVDIFGRLPWSDMQIFNSAPHELPWPAGLTNDINGEVSWLGGTRQADDLKVAKWSGSVPKDVVSSACWNDFYQSRWRSVSYVYPVQSSVDFWVAGGGVDVWLADDSAPYVAPLARAVDFIFTVDGYIPRPTGYPDKAYTRPVKQSADLRLARVIELILSADGRPVLYPSTRDSGRSVLWARPVVGNHIRYLPWGRYSRPLNPGWGIVVPSGPAKPGNGSSIIIPIKRYYIMANEVFLLRIEDNMMIPATDLSISFDRDSWCHQFSATVPYDYLDAVMPSPAPVKVAVFINGTEFRFLIRRPAWSRVFAKSSVGISGYGVACEIDTPYVDESYRTNDVAMTAQQLIDAALEYSTYTQDWQISDWLVPAGALSMTGSPIAVANHVADAAGAVLSADWSQNILRMMPRYPVKPWDWDTAVPDYVIPASVAESESGELVENTEYNAVFISGIEQGIIGRVRRSGTAGDLVAPMVTHPLICHPVAAEQKGVSVLGASGQRVIRQITMPVLDEIGIVEQCRLIEFSDGSKTHRGVTCANNISASWPTVRQTITVETLT